DREHAPGSLLGSTLRRRRSDRRRGFPPSTPSAENGPTLRNDGRLGQELAPRGPGLHHGERRPGSAGLPAPTVSPISVADRGSVSERRHGWRARPRSRRDPDARRPPARPTPPRGPGLSRPARDYG